MDGAPVLGGVAHLEHDSEGSPQGPESRNRREGAEARRSAWHGRFAYGWSPSGIRVPASHRRSSSVLTAQSPVPVAVPSVPDGPDPVVRVTWL